MMRRHGNSPGIEHTVDKRVGRWQLLGRYHKLPRKFEDDYVLESKVLGTGLTGPVKLARCLSEQCQDRRFAVKSFNTSKMSSKAKAMLQSEVEVYLCMDHPHVARLVNVYESAQSLNIVMECMEGGELFDRIADVQRFQESEAAQVTRQMLLAVNYLHSHGIVHRDLKLENFLYDTKGGQHLKLIDFGFSKFRDPSVKLKTACGTLSYVAPEVLGDYGYGAQCDMWSLGVIVFILLAGYMPFGGKDETSQRKKIMSGDYILKPSRWKNISIEAKRFVQAMLTVSPSDRLTSKGALNDAWIKRHHEEATFDTTIVDSLKDFSQAPTLRRCCLKAMAWLLSNQETEKVRDQFKLLDSDSGGTISLAELQSVMVERCNVQQRDVEDMFKAIDMNHDEEINYTDFLAAVMGKNIRISDGLLKATFRHFDTDLSGYITCDDLKNMVGGSSFEGESVEALIEKADASQDGRIDYTEFAAFVRGATVDIATLRQAVSMGKEKLEQRQKLDQRNCAYEYAWEVEGQDSSKTGGGNACCIVM